MANADHVTNFHSLYSQSEASDAVRDRDATTIILTRNYSTPGKAHMQAALELVGYLIGTKDLCVRYARSSTGNIPEFYEQGGERAAQQQRTTS